MMSHCLIAAEETSRAEFQLATFSADVTIPLYHRCMGVLPTKSKRIVDPLYARGFVLLGSDKPIVLAAVDWCEIRNGAYDRWRESLAKAVGTTRERVLVCSLHQHDAPVTDAGAAAILHEVGLAGELYDEEFHQVAINRVVKSMTEALKLPTTITHLGTGQAKVERIASNRRVVRDNGSITYARGSSSGGDPFYRDAPDGEIDSMLKTLSFWNGDQPVAVLHVYATHPMSSYGRGDVSSDFVGLARAKMQKAHPGVMQIYASGCAGDVTAGRYNDGSPKNRVELIDRLYAAMQAAWKATSRQPLTTIDFRSEPLTLEFHPHPHLTEEALTSAVTDETKSTEDRILAAMGLSSRRRVANEQPIDVPCLNFGSTKLVLFPGETFVGYQLLAQEMAPDSFVVSIAYGECWPGYIPTRAAFGENFHDKWLWVAPGSEARIRKVLEKLLQ